MSDPDWKNECGEANEYLYNSASGNRSHAYLLPAINELLSRYPEAKSVLDFGCGNGSLTSALHVSEKCRVVGVDISESGIREASAAFEGIEFMVGDLSDTSIRSKISSKFDVIVCTEVIEHVYSPRKLVDNLCHFLSPEGVVIVSTPYHGYLKNAVLALSGRLDGHFTALWDHGHIKFWSFDTLSRLFEERGLDVVSFRGVGRVPFLWKSMVMCGRLRR